LGDVRGRWSLGNIMEEELKQRLEEEELRWSLWEVELNQSQGWWSSGQR
jgi:hypothetical protein